MARPVIASIEFRDNPPGPRRVVLGRRNRFDVYGENFTKDNAALIIEGLLGDFDVQWSRIRVRFIDSGHLDCDARPDLGVRSPAPAFDDGDITVTVTNGDGPSPPFTETVDYTTIPLDGQPAGNGTVPGPKADAPAIQSVRFLGSTNPRRVLLARDNAFEIAGQNFADAGLAVTMSGVLADGTPVNWTVRTKTRVSATLIRGMARPTKGSKKGKGAIASLDSEGDLTVTVSNGDGPSPPYTETVDYLAQGAHADTNGAGRSGHTPRKLTV